MFGCIQSYPELHVGPWATGWTGLFQPFSVNPMTLPQERYPISHVIVTMSDISVSCYALDIPVDTGWFTMQHRTNKAEFLHVSNLP